jgi:hypothetical protein
MSKHVPSSRKMRVQMSAHYGESIAFKCPRIMAKVSRPNVRGSSLQWRVQMSAALACDGTSKCPRYSACFRVVFRFALAISASTNRSAYSRNVLKAWLLHRTPPHKKVVLFMVRDTRLGLSGSLALGETPRAQLFHPSSIRAGIAPDRKSRSHNRPKSKTRRLR